VYGTASTQKINDAMKLSHKTITSAAAALFTFITLHSCQAQSDLAMIDPSKSEIETKKPLPIHECDYIENGKIQVVFALDVTGSMSGLISAAKDKIWSIASSLSQGDEGTEVSMGIVAYRDRGDNFVTKVTDLNTDLDIVFAELQALSAAGGGDTPESVNQALYDAIHKISWDESPTTMRTIFMVGDCPPHMDYPDDVKYPESCQIARQKDIVVNTILMGANSGTALTWGDMASLGGGDYFATGMDAGSLAISTPFDEEIRKKSAEIEESKVYWGTDDVRENQETIKGMKIKTESTMTVESAARRAEYINSGAADDDFYGENELLNDVATGAIKIADIDEDLLPSELKKVSEEEREEVILGMIETRIANKEDLEMLIIERQNYIEMNVAEVDKKSSLTHNVFNSLQKQAKKKKIRTKATASY